MGSLQDYRLTDYKNLTLGRNLRVVPLAVSLLRQGALQLLQQLRLA